jgi:hypothetical protein
MWRLFLRVSGQMSLKLADGMAPEGPHMLARLKRHAMAVLVAEQERRNRTGRKL